MPVPVVGVDPGPDWAVQIDNCLTIIDGHDHSPGYGVKINPAGIDINGPLSFNTNSATTLLSAQYVSQMTTLVGASSTYVVNGDLYYNNGAGVPVQLTSGGSIVGAAGSIAGLVSPASASYVSGSSTFVWQSNAFTPANMDMASITLRNLIANSNGLTLEAPAAMGVSYTLVLPALPVGGTRLMTLDTSGNMAANTTIDNVTLTNVGGVIGVPASGITDTQIAPATITKDKLAALGQQISASCGVFTTTSTTAVPVTNLTVTIITTGRPIMIGLQNSCTAPGSEGQIGANTNGNGGLILSLYKGAALISNYTLAFTAEPNDGWTTYPTLTTPPPSVFLIDPVAAGTYTYTVKLQALPGSLAYCDFVQLFAYEL
jgi:hypothetical protein